MKKTAFVLFVFLGGSGICIAQDPAEGYWLSVDDKTGKITAGWEIYQENGKLYGKVLSTVEHDPGARALRCRESYRDFPAAGKVNEMIVVGTPWIFGLVREAPGKWHRGNVIDPSNGNIYLCKITYHPADGKKFKVDTLEMRGEIALGVGLSQYWPRTDRETAGSQRRR